VIAPNFFDNCALVGIDVQKLGRRQHFKSTDELPAGWRKKGFAVADCNAAIDYARRVALPNVKKTVEAARQLGLPIVFIHWDSPSRDGIDVAPAHRQDLLAQLGGDCEPPLHSTPSATALRQQRADYVVLAATDQDAFTSSYIGLVLENLGAQNIVFIGGHAGAGGCLERTAKHAKQLGFNILCVEDATSDARQSARRQSILDTGYDHIVSTQQFLELAQHNPGHPLGGQ